MQPLRFSARRHWSGGRWPRAFSIVERFPATLTAHDLDAFAALFADDYVNHQQSAAAPPPVAGAAEDGDSQRFRGPPQGPAGSRGLHPGEPRRGR